MDRREVIFAVLLAGVGLGGATMTEVGTAVFPGNDALIFGIGAAVVAASFLGLLTLVVFPKARTPRTVSAQVPSAQPDLTLFSTQRNEPDPGEGITPAKLFAMCAGKTEAQCDYAAADYVGTSIKVSGQIVAISRLLDKTSVTIWIGEGMRNSAFLVFNEGHARLLVMHKGETLSAEGRITKISDCEIQLQDCRLVL
jgi:hypothetical protein